MLIDANEVPRGTTLTCDLCIVGAGAAGITIARELANGPLDIIVLESGGFERDDATQDLADGELAGERLVSHFGEAQLVDSRLRLFGGTTDHWAGYCRPLEPVDFEPRPWLDSPGWPFPRSELEPWYDRAAEVIQLASTHFDWEWWHEHHDVGTPLLDTEQATAAIYQIHFPFKFGDAYRSEIVDAGNIRLVLWANVVNLASEGEAVRAAQVRTLAGNELEVEARAFVVAVGGIDTPKLLLASNEERPAGLGNEHDLVGRYFAEHLQVPVGFAVFEPSPHDLRIYNGTELADKRRAMKAVITLDAETVLSNEMLGLEAQILLGELREGSPSYDAGVTITEAGELTEVISGTAPLTGAYLLALAEQAPNPQSRVMLSRERDALGVPRVKLDWQRTDLDRTSMLEGLEIMGAGFGRTGLGRLQLVPGAMRTNEDIPDDATPIGLYRVDTRRIDLDGFGIGVGFHHMGTARMAQDPRQGVVDPDARVHSVANLWLAGSSVFPIYGSATPTFTIVALALRLAEHLRGELI